MAVFRIDSSSIGNLQTDSIIATGSLQGTASFATSASWASSTRLTVGTTAVTSGTNTRVFFQSGSVVQQDANFTFDNTLKRLTLKAVGTAATDIPIIVQDSAAANNLFEFRGNGQLYNINNTSGISAISTLTTTDNLSAPSLRVVSTGGNSSAMIAATRLAGSGVSATATNRGFVYLESLGGSHCVIGANDGIAFSAQGISSYNPTSDQMRLRNGILSIGTGYTGTARLDVKAQGALSTDVAFRVRNSADTKNIIEVRGDSEIRFNGLPAVGNYVAIKNYTSYDATIDLMTGDGVKAQIFNDNTSNTNLHRGLNIWNPGIVGSATAKINNIIKSGLSAYGQAYGFNWAITSNSSGTYTQAERAMFLTHQNSLVLYSGSSSPTDAFGEKSGSFEIFASSSTSTAGVVPHFKTERGTILWLGSESRLFNVTASNISASNVTASSLTIPSGSITITTGSITMPNRPAFRVTGAGGAKVAVTTLSGSYLNIDYQQGSGWDNSTGTFTAPTAGLYQVNVAVRTNSNSLGVISQLIVYKNNTGGTTGTPQIMIEFGTNTSMNHAGGSTISKLAVGDTLKMVVASGEISFDANDNFSVAYIG